MKVKELSIEQLNALIEEIVEEKVQEILGDPGEGLELREEIIRRLKARKVSKKAAIPFEKVAKRYGFELR